MKAYSSIDLLGERLNKRNQEVFSLWEVIKKLFVPESKYVYLDIAIPTLLYLRTEAYCEVLSKELEDGCDSEDFLYIIYKDFINKFFRYQQHRKTFELIEKYRYREAPLLISDYREGVEYEVREKVLSKAERMTLKFEKRLTLKGELILAELDDIYGVSIKLEKLIEIVWVDYIENSKKISEKRMISEFHKLILEVQE